MQYNTVEELEDCLISKNLPSGVNSYYDYIWKATLGNLPEKYFYVNDVLAGVLSLLDKKIRPDTKASIYRILIWTIMRGKEYFKIYIQW
ncbi:hypothetical protein CUU64_20520 [Bacillus sp. V5-8f]|nr:hypothetical protein CUU64_20520 [Bacillus sp. V5-8f]